MKLTRSIIIIFLLIINNRCYGLSILVLNQVFNTPTSYITYDTVIIRNCLFTNIAGDGLRCFNTKYLLIDSCVFSNITLRAVNIRGAKYAIIQNSFFDRIQDALFIGYESQDIFTHSNDNASTRSDSLFISNNRINNIYNNAVRVFNTSFLDFDHNLIDSCLGSGIILGSGTGVGSCSLLDESPLSAISIAIRNETRMNGCILRNNTILHTLSDGIGTLENVYHAQILNNEIAYVAYDGIGGRINFGDHGMYLQGPDVLVEGNKVHHVLDSCGSAGCDGVGISFRTSAIINRNIIHNCFNSGIAYFNDHPAGTGDSYITNNVVYDNKRTAIYINTGCPESVPDSIHIYHNTIISQPVQALWLHACPIGFANYSGYKDVIGNILVYEGVADSSHFVFNTSGAINDLYNIKHSGDAGFANFALRDLRLSASSSAINFLPASYTLVPNDIQGKLRISPADAGSYEYYYPVIVRDTGHIIHYFTQIDSSQIYDTVIISNVLGITDTIFISMLVVTCDTVANTSTSAIDSTQITTYDTVFISYVLSRYDSASIHCILYKTDSIFVPALVNGTSGFPIYIKCKVYPSVGNGRLVIKQSGDVLATKAILYDITGRQVDLIPLSGETSVIDISSRVSAGTYLLNLQGKQFSTTQLIVITPH